jgi:hypothetical protein
VKVPAPLLPNVTEPEGVTGVPVIVSVTVAVQAVCALTGTGVGLQLKLIVVVCKGVSSIEIVPLTRVYVFPPPRPLCPLMPTTVMVVPVTTRPVLTSRAAKVPVDWYSPRVLVVAVEHCLSAVDTVC